MLLCWEEGVALTGSLNPSPTRKHTSFSFAASACRRRGAHSRKKLVLILPRGLRSASAKCAVREPLTESGCVSVKFRPFYSSPGEV